MAHCALGIFKANFSSDVGQFDLEAESLSSGISEEVSVSIMCVWGEQS